jgi:fatty-acyl-CoA synthase
VVGVPHADWGEAVHAEIVLKSGCSVTPDELIAVTRTILGSYKAPKSIVFVETLPLSVVGKVLRREVKQKYWQASQRKVS